MRARWTLASAGAATLIAAVAVAQVTPDGAAPADQIRQLEAAKEQSAAAAAR